MLHFTILPFQPTFWHRGASVWHVNGSFWHVDGHIYYFTLYYSPCPTYFLACRRGHCGMPTGTITILHFAILPFQPTFWHRGASFWHVDGVILACRRAHLLFYALLLSLSNLLLGIAGRHFGMSTGSFWHVHGHIFYFNTILHFSPLPPYFLASWAHLLFYTLLLSCPTYFLASGGVILACRRAQVLVLSCRRAHVLFYTLLFSLSNLLILGIAGRHFGMSTGSFWHVKGHIYYFTLYFLPFQPSFWHRGASFWHFDGHTFFFTVYYSPFPDYFLASMRSSLALPHICYAMRCSSGSGLGVGWGVVGCDNVLWF